MKVVSVDVRVVDVVETRQRQRLERSQLWPVLVLKDNPFLYEAENVHYVRMQGQKKNQKGVSYSSKNIP